MRRHYVIASHSILAEGMEKTLKFFVGNETNIEVLTAYVNNTPIDDDIKKIMDGIVEDDEIVILTDLKGGSVNQKFFPFIYRSHTHLITGMNLPLAMSLVMEPTENYLIPERVQEIVDESRQQLEYINPTTQGQAEDDEDE